MRPHNIDLSNWRQFPNSQWSFQHVTEVVPCAIVDNNSAEFLDPYVGLGIDSIGNIQCGEKKESLHEFLKTTHTDGFIVSHKGSPVANWYAEHFNPAKPHLLFSVSKSITAMVAGILQDRGLLVPEALVGEYLELPANSAYADCTVQNVLDMTVALGFEEDYTNEATDYIQYRQASGWNPADQSVPQQGLRSFVLAIKKRQDEHGEVFRYRSPNSDLLGMILASAANQSFPELMEQLLWKPLGARSQAWITVDRWGDARTAGGICTTLADLSRLGQLICDEGKNSDQEQLLSSSWLTEIMHGGNFEAWQKGEFSYIFPHGRYRNKWYQLGDDDHCVCAMGIHGQYLFINPTRKVVISRVASQPLPVDESVEPDVLKVMSDIASQFDQ